MKQELQEETRQSDLPFSGYDVSRNYNDEVFTGFFRQQRYHGDSFTFRILVKALNAPSLP